MTSKVITTFVRDAKQYISLCLLQCVISYKSNLELLKVHATVYLTVGKGKEAQAKN